MSVHPPGIPNFRRQRSTISILAAMLGVILVPVRAEPVQYQTHTFDVRECYRESDTVEDLNPAAVSRLRDLIRNVDPEIIQIGTLPTWIFPPFAESPLEPPRLASTFTGVVPLSRLQCIPPIGSQEYRRLVSIRTQIWGRIVREFPEIINWILGPEPDLRYFVDCQGNTLGRYDPHYMVRFIVDTLESLYPIIKNGNPCANVIADFRGRYGWGSQSIRNRIRKEIQRRGGDPTEYYDLLVHQLAPSGGIALDRFPDGRCTSDFAFFGNGSSIQSDLVLVNVTTSEISPAVYFYDQSGDLMYADSVVDVTGDLEIQNSGALSVQTEVAPLGELEISTHGRGNLVTGSVRVVSDSPIGGVLRFNVPDVGVAGVGISQPVQDALFPVRRHAGGVRTAAAIHNLGREVAVVTCQLMKDGTVLEEAEVPIEANGQVAIFIEELFTDTDTSDFVGSVRCTSSSRELFTAVAVEMDSANRIFTTLPVVPVPR